MAVTKFHRYSFLSILVLAIAPAQSAVLPEDRFDVMYFQYSGGGIDIDGPSVLVRKDIKDKVSVSANHLVDNVSGASIDVETTASAYTEKRTENTLGMSYLHDKTITSFSVTDSSENDFEARSVYFGIGQDFFGGLSNLSIGFVRGDDEIRQTGQADFKETANRSHFQFAFSQILSKNLLLNFSYETITDEGFLNNPYRSVRYIDPSTPVGYSYEPEVYPNTRTSNAASIRSIYHLPYRASIMAEYRYFTDTWDIRADTFRLRYTHPINKQWTTSISYRLYDQTQANFYNDLFPFPNAQNFRARDKELSTFSNYSIGGKIGYEWRHADWKRIDRVSFNIAVDYINFEYDNFRDLRHSTQAGAEPLYDFSATASRFFVSVWY